MIHTQGTSESQLTTGIPVATALVKRNKDILHIATLEMFERLINRDTTSYALDMLVMPGTLEDKHKNCETIPALRRQFNLIY